MSFDDVVASVRERVSPDSEARERVRTVADELRERTLAALDTMAVEGDVELVGSTARGTWLAGDRDVDVFVRFPTDISREDLQEYGLAVGHEVLEDGREEYAEHPYVTGEYEGFAVDIVPCYAVDSAADIRTAVDRTPFHNDYLAERLDEESAGEIRVAKAFLKAIETYGSDLRTRGFSGYLVELLVLEYDGFRGLIEAAAAWHPPVELDPAGHGRAEFRDPLVVIDPTDPERNVAAVCSDENVARLQHYARDLLADPREELFEPDDPPSLNDFEIQGLLQRRDSAIVAVIVEIPDLVDDQLYPQLDRSVDGIASELDRRGFEVLRTARFASDELGVMIIDCGVKRLAAVQRHEGPPVAEREYASEFVEKYREGTAIGPYIDGDRYVVERARQFQTPGDFLRSEELLDVALGTAIKEALEDKYQVLEDGGIAALEAEFGPELARYFSPRP